MCSVKPPKECLVCLNSNETIFVPNEDSQKIFKVCFSYIKDAINIEFLINNINENSNKLSFCKNCFHSSLNIFELVEKLLKLKKEINDLASCFSDNIEKQRIQAKVKIENGENTKIHSANNPIADLDSSDDPLHEIQIRNDSAREVYLEASNGLIEEQIQIDGINSVIVKTESDGIFLDYEDESGTDHLNTYNAQEFNTNYLLTDPLVEVELETTSAIVNKNCIITNNKSTPKGSSKSIPQLVSSVTLPNAALKGIETDVICNRGVTFDSTPSSYQNKPVLHWNQNIPIGRGPICNSITGTTNLKQTSGKIRKEYKHKCQICQKRFHTPSMLKRHHVTHTGEKPFQCAVCGKSFTRYNTLRIHKRRHDQQEYDTNYLMPDNEIDPLKEIELESTFVNNSCDTINDSNPKVGPSKSITELASSVSRPNTELTAEMGQNCKTETTNSKYKAISIRKEYKHKCQICQNTFRTPSMLMRHNLTHTGEKPFQCEVCEKSFTRSSTLKIHTRLHTGETPYKCSYCDMMFMSKFIRGRHENIVHPHNV